MLFARLPFLGPAVRGELVIPNQTPCANYPIQNSHDKDVCVNFLIFSLFGLPILDRLVLAYLFWAGPLYYSALHELTYVGRVDLTLLCCAARVASTFHNSQDELV